jgi:hypothetical protein
LKNSALNVIRLEILIDRAQFDKLVRLGIVDPSKRKNGITQAVRRGLDYVIDNEVSWGNHVRRKK